MGAWGEAGWHNNAEAWVQGGTGAHVYTMLTLHCRGIGAGGHNNAEAWVQGERQAGILMQRHGAGGGRGV
jgi:hypothetical protein